MHEALTYFGRPVAELERAWGAGASTTSDDGWCRVVWSQTWFGEVVAARYTFDPKGSLIRIDYSTPDATRTIASIRAELGEPTKEGPAPHFLNCDAVAVWEGDGFKIMLEDYAPGCEIGIIGRR